MSRPKQADFDNNRLFPMSKKRVTNLNKSERVMFCAYNHVSKFNLYDKLYCHCTMIYEALNDVILKHNMKFCCCHPHNLNVLAKIVMLQPQCRTVE